MHRLLVTGPSHQEIHEQQRALWSLAAHCQPPSSGRQGAGHSTLQTSCSVVDNIKFVVELFVRPAVNLTGMIKYTIFHASTVYYLVRKMCLVYISVI